MRGASMMAFWLHRAGPRACGSRPAAPGTRYAGSCLLRCGGTLVLYGWLPGSSPGPNLWLDYRGGISEELGAGARGKERGLGLRNINHVRFFTKKKGMNVGERGQSAIHAVRCRELRAGIRYFLYECNFGSPSNINLTDIENGKTRRSSRCEFRLYQFKLTPKTTCSNGV